MGPRGRGGTLKIRKPDFSEKVTKRTKGLVVFEVFCSIVSLSSGSMVQAGSFKAVAGKGASG